LFLEFYLHRHEFLVSMSYSHAFNYVVCLAYWTDWTMSDAPSSSRVQHWTTPGASRFEPGERNDGAFHGGGGGSSGSSHEASSSSPTDRGKPDPALPKDYGAQMQNVSESKDQSDSGSDESSQPSKKSRSDEGSSSLSSGESEAPSDIRHHLAEQDADHTYADDDDDESGDSPLEF
jgi:hypothetical protein